MVVGCPSETRQVRSAPLDTRAIDAGPDSPERPKTEPQDDCLVYPHTHARLGAGARNGATAQAAFEEGQALATSGDHAAALAAFDRAVAADPYHGLTHLAAAESHLYTDNDVEAMRLHLASAVVLLPSNPRAHFRLAELAAEIGEHSVALTHCRCALELKPSYTEARMLLARQLAASKRHAEAEAELRRVLADGERDVAVRVLLAQVLEAQGKVLEAGQELETAARETGSSAALFRNAARLYEAADSPLSARRMRAVADRLDPPPDQRKMRPLRRRSGAQRRSKGP